MRRAAAIVALLGAQFALRWYADRRFPLRFSLPPGAWFRELAPIDRAAAGAAASAWLTGLVAAVLPATWWDPIAYHLPLFAFALERHTFALQPMVPSAFPQLADAAALPAFEQVCASAGGYGERVEDPAEVPAALARASHAVTRERRQALLNVICAAPGGPL